VFEVHFVLPIIGARLNFGLLDAVIGAKRCIERYIGLPSLKGVQMESYQIAEILMALIISGGVLGGLGIAAWAWVKRRPQIGTNDLAKLAESIEGLRESVDGMRDESSEIFDRLDFNERVLSQIADGLRAGQGELPKGR
jgi:hypothetical protein